MNPDLFVAVLLDRSGSMGGIQGSTIEAFNGFLKGLRAQEGRSLVTLTQFDSESIDILYEAREAAAAPLLTTETYIPRGMTPLFDAAGQTLAATEQRLRALGWTGNVLVVFVTDGLENASTEWTRERVFARVKELEEKGWTFMYLGAHADAYTEGAAMGVAPGNVARYSKDARGSKAMGDHVATSTYNLRHNLRSNKQMVLDEERKWLEGDEH